MAGERDGVRPVERRRRWPFGPAATVLVLGLVATGILTFVAVLLYSNNENRLLRLRARDASSLLTEAVPSIQTPLASASALADATRGNPRKFMRFVRPYVGAGPAHTFVSVSLWREGTGSPRPLVVVGLRPTLAAGTTDTEKFLDRAANGQTLSVVGFLRLRRPILGYAFSGRGTAGPFVAYGESSLRANRYQRPPPSSSFSDLNYAIYLGRSQAPSRLLVTSAPKLPLMGHVSSISVPFGDNHLTLAVSAAGALGGSLPERLPWVIAIAGVLLTLGAAALATRLIERRRHAEVLAEQLEVVADENRRLFTEQQGIAQTLQRALLPEALPELPGLQAAVRYESGVQGVDIGGDWYDLIPAGERRLLLVVGDVSGRGLRAAATMASLRYAVHAYAAEGDPPTTILTKLSRLVSVRESGQLATVLCATIDIDAHELTVASAGHLPPLLIANGSSRFIGGTVGVPIGVEYEATYTAATATAPAGATLLAFTDGLVERRGESIDAGLERLRQKASNLELPLEALLTHVVDELRDDQADDDTAIAAIRWLT